MKHLYPLAVEIRKVAVNLTAEEREAAGWFLEGVTAAITNRAKEAGRG